ncbi:hypothetical protein Tco_1184350 [Tanacetum coccineum]
MEITTKNEEMEITATINGRVKTVTEASIRRHLKLEDSDCISTLPNIEIFEQPALMGYERTSIVRLIILRLTEANNLVELIHVVMVKTVVEVDLIAFSIIRTSFHEVRVVQDTMKLIKVGDVHIIDQLSKSQRYTASEMLELENFFFQENNALAKLPMLKLGEYEMWEIRIKQYFQIQDYALWEVIENGNFVVPIPVTAPESGLSTALKMTVAWLQKLVSRLAILGVDTPPEDLNVKFLRSLPSEWDTHVVILPVNVRHPRSKDNRNWNQGSSSIAVRIEDASEKAMCAIDYAGFDWSDTAEEEIQANMALMAFSDSEYDDLLVKLDDTGFKASTYKRGLSILEGQILKYKESGVLFSEEIALLKRSVASNVPQHMLQGHVLMKSGLKNVNTARPVNTVRSINTGRPFSTGRERGFNDVKPLACWVWKPIKPNGASLSNSQLNDKGFVDSRCLRHMTGNIAHLLDFKDFDRVVAGKSTNDFAGIQGVSESSTSSQQDQDWIVMPIWKDASYFGDTSPKIVDDAQIEDKDELHDEDDFNTARPDINTGSREVSTALPEVNTATPEDLSSVQTRRMKTSYSEKGFLSAIYEGKTHQDLNVMSFLFVSSSRRNKKSFLKLLRFQHGNKKDEGDCHRNKARLVASKTYCKKRLRLIMKSFAPIEEEVYVCQPPGFEDPDHPDKVYKIWKSLWFKIEIAADVEEIFIDLDRLLMDDLLAMQETKRFVATSTTEADMWLLQVAVDRIAMKCEMVPQ